MANSIVFTARDAEGERILDAFAQRTGLRFETDDDTRTFSVEADEHHVQVVRTLTDIDERWTDHISLQDPA